MNLKVYVDADFAGLFGREQGNDPNTARSRLGYVVLLGGVPLTWRSQLMTDVCLSTLEAEYSALSSALRTVIPIRNVLMDLLAHVRLTLDPFTDVACLLFEDNQGAYLLATQQRLSPRTKYFAVKMHFFWSFVYHPELNPNGWIRIVKVESAKQLADMLTKGLAIPLFVPCRKQVQGW